jgi:hypothetical protein
MISFLGCGFEQVRAQRRVARDCGLAEIQRLRADLADVVDAHEAGRVAAFGFIERGIGDVAGR